MPTDEALAPISYQHQTMNIWSRPMAPRIVSGSPIMCIIAFVQAHTCRYFLPALKQLLLEHSLCENQFLFPLCTFYFSLFHMRAECQKHRLDGRGPLVVPVQSRSCPSVLSREIKNVGQRNIYALLSINNVLEALEKNFRKELWCPTFFYRKFFWRLKNGLNLSWLWYFRSSWRLVRNYNTICVWAVAIGDSPSEARLINAYDHELAYGLMRW